MTTYLTTAEVADLKGCSLQYVQKCIKEGKIKASVRETAANNRTEYCILLTDLPEKMQIQWENKKRSELGLEPMPLPCKSAPKPDPRQITLQDLTGDQRDNVGFWCEILQEWQRVHASRGDNLGKCKVNELYCATVKLKYPNISISPDILYRKYKAYKNGDLAGLVDHRGGHNKGKSSIPQYIPYLTESNEDIADAERAINENKRVIKQFAKGIVEALDPDKQIDMLALMAKKGAEGKAKFKPKLPETFTPIFSEEQIEKHPQLRDITQITSIIELMSANAQAARKDG